jgi:hypothetical protein
MDCRNPGLRDLDSPHSPQQYTLASVLSHTLLQQARQLNRSTCVHTQWYIFLPARLVQLHRAPVAMTRHAGETPD